MSTLKFSIANYYKPTPARIRKIADSILAGVLFLSASSIFNEHSGFALAIFSVGAIAKVVSNFFTEDV